MKHPSTFPRWLLLLGLWAGGQTGQGQLASTRSTLPPQLLHAPLTVSLNHENRPLDVILRDIERQTPYSFVYGTDRLRALRGSVNAERRPLTEVLDGLLRPIGFEYHILEKQIILSRREQPDRTLTGRVTDATTGDGLPGVSISVKGTSRGTTSTADGSYRLAIPDGGSPLTFSSVGYARQEIMVGDGQTTLDVKLVQDARTLDEVQIVAFGEQRRRDVTGSISSLKAADIRTNLAASPDVALQGRAAGVQITQAGGSPGGAVRINVRGVASINSNSQPLLVVDGVPIVSGAYGTGGVAMNPLAELNPDDIESIDVLKDASASVLYGSRAANGVLLITTKRGKSGKPSFDLSYQQGASNPTNRVDYLGNGADYLNVLKRAAANNRNAGLLSASTNLVSLLPAGILAGSAANIPANLLVDSTTLYNTRTNWLDQVLRQGTYRQATLSASAGSEKFSVYLSGSYRKDEGIVVGQSLQRVGGRVNVTFNPTKKLSFGLNTTLNGLENRTIPLGNSYQYALNSALPAYPIQLPDGTYFNGINQGNNAVNIGTNPVFYRNNYSNQTNTLRSISTAYAQVQLLPGLTFRTEWGYDYQTNKNDVLFTPTLYPANLNGREKNGNGKAEKRDATSDTWNTNNTLTYTKTFQDKHRLTLLAGNSVQSQTNRANTYFTENVPEGQKYGLDTARIVLVDDSPAFRFASFFGRVNYAYRDRYLFEASFRTDGSSRFPPGNRFASFPGVSVGWVLSEEGFLQRALPALNFLKIRASYGATGNAEIGNFSWQKSFTIVGANDAIYGGLQGARFVNPGNQALTWETTRQADLGLEFGFLNNRIQGTLDFYNKVSEGLLLEYSLGPLFGTITNAMTINLGSVRNRGVEFSLSTKNITRPHFRWSSDFNISRNKNVVLSTYAARFLNYEYQFISGPGIAAPGYALGTYYMPVFAGFDPNTGNELFRERDRTAFAVTGQTIATGNVWDGTVNNQSANNQFVLDGKSPYPTVFGGLTNTFTLRQFDLSFLIYFQAGNWIYDQGERAQSYPALGQVLRASAPGIGDLRQEVRNAEGGGVYRLQFNSNARSFESTRFLHDGSYARLKNVSLGYSLPATVAKKIRLRSLRVSLTGQNLLTWTKFKGWDPEVFPNGGGGNQGQANLGPGVTNNDLPQVRTYVVGLNVGF